MPQKPWSVYNASKGQKPLAPNEIEELAVKCDNYSVPLGAAVRCAFLCGLRVGELFEYNYEKVLPGLEKPYDKLILCRPGPRCENIWSVANETSGDETLWFSIVRQRKGSSLITAIPELLKRFNGDNKKTFEYIRSRVHWHDPVPVPLTFISQGTMTEDAVLVKGLSIYMHSYLPSLHKLNLNIPLDYMKWKNLELFPVTRSWLENKLRHVTKGTITWHMLRQSRMTWLSQQYSLSSSDLLFYGQWSASSPMPMRYTQSGPWSIQSRIREKFADQVAEKKVEQHLNEQALEQMPVVDDKVIEVEETNKKSNNVETFNVVDTFDIIDGEDDYT